MKTKKSFGRILIRITSSTMFSSASKVWKKGCLYLVSMGMFTYTVCILIRKRLITFLSQEKTADDLVEGTCVEDWIEMETQLTLSKPSRWLLIRMTTIIESAHICKPEDLSLWSGVKSPTYSGNQKSKSQLMLPWTKKSHDFTWLSKLASIKMLYLWTWLTKRSNSWSLAMPSPMSFKK